MACAIRELVSMAGGADKAHVICGDFNSWPGTPIYQLTQEGYLNDHSMTALQAIHSVQLPDGQVRFQYFELICSVVLTEILFIGELTSYNHITLVVVY